MGVEYRRLLIPRDNTWRPDAAGLARLVEAWRANTYVVVPGSESHAAMNFATGSANHAHAASTGASVQTRDGWQSLSDRALETTDEGELILRWPVTNSLDCDLKHPLGLADPIEGTYYDIEVHLADDFVDHSDEGIDPVDPSCACGANLSYWPERQDDIFYTGRVRRHCPSCGRVFRPQDQVVVYRDGITGEESELVGGSVYRFAIVINCGKCWRTSVEEPDAAPATTADFLAVSSDALGIPLYEIGSFS